FAETGSVYSSAEAMANGLVDAVGTYGDAMAALVAAVAAAGPPAISLEEPATEEDEEEDDSEPVPPIPEAPQESSMSTKPNADAAASQEFTGEEKGLLRRFLGALSGKPA